MASDPQEEEAPPCAPPQDSSKVQEKRERSPEPDWFPEWREGMKCRFRFLKSLGVDVSYMESIIDTHDPRPGMAAQKARAEERRKAWQEQREELINLYSNAPIDMDKMAARLKGAKYDSRTPSVSKIDKVKAKELATQSFDEYAKLEVGDHADKGTEFCHWSLAVDYPNAYIGKVNYVKAASLFEDLLEGFVWDFFYLYHPRNHRHPPKLFVPTKQFVRFLDYVNATVGIKLTIPAGKAGLSFRATFQMNGSDGPRYLGRCTQRVEFEKLKKNQPDWDEDDACRGAHKTDLDEIVAKLRACSSNDPKGHEKELAARGREATAKNRRTELQAIHHLLGLRPDEKTHFDKQGNVLAFDMANGVPFKPYKDAVFASIDLEVAEGSATMVYEIGISVLDTRDIVNIDPGECGSNWYPLIKSHHLLTYEYRTCRNAKYVKGCPDMFQFGESELVKEDHLSKAMLAILKQYIYPDGATDSDWEKHRPLVVVGHGFRSDMAYLNTIGIDLMSDIYSLTSIIDTQRLDQTAHDMPQPRSLGTLLNEFEIKHTYLHNAGNDAAYTLQAMIALAVETRRHELAELAELEQELGQDTGKVPAPVPERTQAVKNFDEALRKKRRPGEDSEVWRYRYHGY